MADPAVVFLSREEVEDIHQRLLTRYGGFHGLRDAEALTNALAAPGARMNGRWVHEDLAAMAAAYLYPIARYRPFEDGNRRTALVSALVFLALNGRRPAEDPAGLAALTRAAGAGEVDREAVAAWIRSRLEGSSSDALNPPPTAAA
jgi:death-on-curing protein